MLWSRLFIPTLRENPAEAETPGHQLLIRAGYIRQSSFGNYTYLFLAQRAMNRIRRMFQAEMDALGGQEFLFTADASAAVAIARAELRSQKQLPQVWYQLQPKACAWSFDADAGALYPKPQDAYRRILGQLGLNVETVQDTGLIVFAIPSETGSDLIVRCPACHYSASLERAVSIPVPPLAEDPETCAAPEEFHTPGRKTIVEVSEFTQLPPTAQIKSLVMVCDGMPILALVRGDHHLSRSKLGAIVGAVEVRPANPAEIKDWFGADAGSLGPIGITKIRILADNALEGRRNMIAGANKNDYHLRNVTPDRHFTAEFADLRQVAEGDTCTNCGAPLKFQKTIEIGRITPAFSELRIERILPALAQQNCDESGMVLPPAVAPFTLILTPVNNADATLREAAQTLYGDCLAAGIDVLYDDRDERPGVKFKDADLIGIPYRITLGKKLGQGIVELVNRKDRIARDITLSDAVAEVQRSLTLP